MITSRFTTADGCSLQYDVVGQGRPFVWQHGLGANFAQPAVVFPDLEGVQRITLACRGHEESDLGDVSKLSIGTFADDVLALLDHLGIETAGVGGISMGAAIALRLSVQHPTRVSHLALARPAWIDGTSLDSQAANIEVAQLMQKFGAEVGREKFKTSPLFEKLKTDSPDNANSALGYFDRLRPETTLALLTAIANGHPGVSRADIAHIHVPTLVIANGEDVVHPVRLAQTIADLIAGAELRVITSKSIDAQAYVTEFKAALAAFLSLPQT
jgi:pimeloyl-ACP methyl ester carboxylesterase